MNIYMIWRATLYFIAGILLLGGEVMAAKPSPNNDLMLWYNREATIWEEYLPLGNGRVGMMMSGGVASDHIILNEGTMWTGCV